MPTHLPEPVFMNHEYLAPWSRSVKLVTLSSTVVLALAPVLGSNFGPHQFLAWRIFMLLIPLLALPLGILFMVRGYRVTPRSIEIERFGWSTQLSVSGLKVVTADPLALTGSIRRWGNGGFFAITGQYSNGRYGRFRAWATDPARAVVLRYADHTVLLTPDEPQRFVQQVLQVAGLGLAIATASD